MNENESSSKSTDSIGPKELVQMLRELPERFFELMTFGSQLAKQGEFAAAADQFAAARKEGSQILQKLLEFQKSPHAQTWQIFAVLWAFKLVKSVFYWLLAQSEVVETPEERKQLLLAALGTQYVGQDMVRAFQGLDETFTGSDRDLLPLLEEAIRNFQKRQHFLKQTMKEENISFNSVDIDF